MGKITVPLIIGGIDVQASNDDHIFEANSFGNFTSTEKILIQGADPELCIRAVDSSSKAFKTWRKTTPQQRRTLFLRLAQLLRERGDKVRGILEDEIYASKIWSQINLEDGVGILEEVAALVTSNTMAGTIPPTNSPHSQPLVLKEPLGVILGIAPWNSPLILGLRAVAAPIAAGNTAILKGSELSPRVHYFIAKLFQEAGFPPGVLNFILHRPEDAESTFECMITNPAIRKCNFTGSTPVGRSIASRAAAALKPVLLELGGKNFAIVLEGADLDKAARLTLEGAFLNNGQICMSTDTVLVARSSLPAYREKLFTALKHAGSDIGPVINQKSFNRLQSLIDDARTKGAKVTSSERNKQEAVIPVTVLEGLTTDMDFYNAEAFGPLLGMVVFDREEEALRIVNDCPFGLSAAIFTQNHWRAIEMAKELKIGAIHINGSTVHDEPTLPHGGHGDSGWGRFGASWGLDEFLQTKTVILNK